MVAGCLITRRVRASGRLKGIRSFPTQIHPEDEMVTLLRLRIVKGCTNAQSLRLNYPRPKSPGTAHHLTWRPRAPVRAGFPYDSKGFHCDLLARLYTWHVLVRETSKELRYCFFLRVTCMQIGESSNSKSRYQSQYFGTK